MKLPVVQLLLVLSVIGSTNAASKMHELRHLGSSDSSDSSSDSSLSFETCETAFLLDTSSPVVVSTASEMQVVSSEASCTGKGCVSVVKFQLSGSLDCDGTAVLGSKKKLQCIRLEGPGTIPSSCTLDVGGKKPTVLFVDGVVLEGDVRVDQEDGLVSLNNVDVYGLTCPLGYDAYSPQKKNDRSPPTCHSIQRTNALFDYGEAEQLCNATGGSPAYLWTKDENKYVSEALLQSQADPAWLLDDFRGKYDRLKNGKKSSSSSDSAEEEGDCYILDPSSTNWYAVNCSKAYATAVVCSTPKSAAVEPLERARVTGGTTFYFDTVLEFLEEKEKGGLDYPDFGETVSVVIGPSEKVPLSLVLAGTPMSVEVQTAAPNPILTIATDTHPLALNVSYSHNGFTTTADQTDPSFPSLVFLQSDDACVRKATLKVGNATFLERDLSDLASCPRQAGYAFEFDHAQQCVVLSSASLFQDLALDFEQDGCVQASLRRDPPFMESLYFNVEGSGLAGLNFTNALTDIELVPGAPLDDTLRVPVLVRTVGLGAASLSKMSIRAYGSDLPGFGWAASTTTKCLSTCSPFANASGLFFMEDANNTSPMLVSRTLFNITEQGCDQLEEVLLGPDVTGEAACTIAETPLGSFGNVTHSLANLVAADKRTLKIIPSADTVISTNLPPTINLVEGVHLILDASNATVEIGNFTIDVQSGAYLTLIDVTLNATSSLDPVVVFNLGSTTMDGCALDENVFLHSSGILQIVASTVGNSEIVVASGWAEFAYSKITAMKALVNDARLRFERVSIEADSFDFYSGDGTLELLDALLEYTLPSIDAIDFICVEDNGKLVPLEQLVPVDGVDDCIPLCDKNENCTGIWLDSLGLADGADDDSPPLCGLYDGNGGFDCSIDGAIALSRQPVVPFTPLGKNFCPVSNPITISGIGNPLTPDDCRGWCSTFSFCNLYSVDINGNCAFHASPFVVECDAPSQKEVFVNANHDLALGKFVPMPRGTCFADATYELTGIASKLGRQLSSPLDCAAFCGAVSACSAFSNATGSCSFFGWEAMATTNGCPANEISYLSMQDSDFPLAGPLGTSTLKFACAANTAFAESSFVAGGPSSCKAICNISPLCAAFTYQPAPASETDCFLWSASFLDWLLDPSACLPGNGDTYVVSKQVDYVEANTASLACSTPMEPVQEASVLDWCKNVCLRTQGCRSLSFNNDSSCQITCASDVDPVAATHVKTESAVSVPFVAYVDVDSCFSSVSLDLAATYGSSNVNIESCGLLCDLSIECVGYAVQSSACSLFSAVALEDCEKTGGIPSVVSLAFTGNRRANFHVAPSSTIFAYNGTVDQRGTGSVRSCMNVCLSSGGCEAVAVDWNNAGACYLYNSTSFEALDGNIDSSRSVYLGYTKYLYEEALNGTSYLGAAIVASYPNVPTQGACSTLCSIRSTCESIQYSPSNSVCLLLGGGNVVSDKGEGDDPFIVQQIPINPFLTVPPSIVCPDQSAAILQMTGLLEKEACESLCLGNVQCGSMVYNAAMTTCVLYDRSSFLESNCQNVAIGDTISLSYLQFLVRDLPSYVTLTPSQNAQQTAALCTTTGSPIATFSSVSSASSCATLCTEAPRSNPCKAFAFDAGVCRLYSGGDFDFGSCPLSSETIGVSYTRAAFSTSTDRCLADKTTPLQIFGGIGSYPECAALCESTFGCSSFDIDVDFSTCDLYGSDITVPCETTKPDGEYLAFSDRFYTALGNDFCVASNTIIAELDGIQLEACKQVCDTNLKCASIEYNSNGECTLYQSRDFFSCVNTDQELYLSSSRLYESTTPSRTVRLADTCLVWKDGPQASIAAAMSEASIGEPCNDSSDCIFPFVCQSLVGSNFGFDLPSSNNFCVMPPSTSAQIDECISSCIADSRCEGVYMQGSACANLVSSDLDLLEPSTASCPSGTEFHFKYKANPYQTLEGACLLNPLPLPAFLNLDLVDAINVCDSLAFCKHFTRDTTGMVVTYGAQVGGVEDDCTLPMGTTAYWNSRSFIDAVEFMGVPERVFAEIPKITYQECAASCGRLDQCNAFVHDWGFQQNEELLDLTAEPQRLATFTTGRATVLVLNPDGTLAAEAQLSVGDYSDQRIVSEELFGSSLVRLRFRALDQCITVSGGAVIGAACQNGDLNQRWRLSQSNGILKFESTQTGMCLAHNSGTSGRVDLGSCMEGDLVQFQWASGPVRLYSAIDPDKCMTLPPNTVSNDPGSPPLGDIGYAQCDAGNQEQRFTYLYGSKRWLMQRTNYVPREYDEVRGVCYDQFGDEDLRAASSSESCARECDRRLGCNAFSFISPSDGLTYDYTLSLLGLDIGGGYCIFNSGTGGLRRNCDGFTTYIFLDGYSYEADSCMNDGSEKGDSSILPNGTISGEWFDCTTECTLRGDQCKGFEFCLDGVCSDKRLTGFQAPLCSTAPNSGCNMCKSGTTGGIIDRGECVDYQRIEFDLCTADLSGYTAADSCDSLCPFIADSLSGGACYDMAFPGSNTELCGNCDNRPQPISEKDICTHFNNDLTVFSDCNGNPFDCNQASDRSACDDLYWCINSDGEDEVAMYLDDSQSCDDIYTPIPDSAVKKAIADKNAALRQPVCGFCVDACTDSSITECDLCHECPDNDAPRNSNKCFPQDPDTEKCFLFSDYCTWLNRNNDFCVASDIYSSTPFTVTVEANVRPTCILRGANDPATCISDDTKDRFSVYRKSSPKSGGFAIDDDRCLTVDSNNRVKIKACSQLRQAETESELLPGNKIKFGTHGCLARNGTSNFNALSTITVPCDDSAANQVWTRDAICRLTTREALLEFELESVDYPGRCLAMDAKPVNLDGSCTLESSWSTTSVGMTVCNGVAATRFNYFYLQSKDPNARYRMFNALDASQCLGRPVDNSVQDPDLVPGPVRWMGCDENNFAFNSWTLTNGTVFENAKTDEANNANRNFTLLYSPCSQALLSQDSATVAGSPMLSSLSRWRRFGLEGSATEIAVKPTAILQDITDPALKFQIWLWNDEGKRSRQLLSRIEVFSEVTTVLASFIDEVDMSVQKVTKGLDSVTSLTGPLANAVDGIVDFANVIVPILRVFERVPYVGPVLKAIRVRFLVDKAKSTLRKGKKATGPFNTTFAAAETTVGTLAVNIDSFRDFFGELPNTLAVFGRIITRLVRCSYVDGNGALQNVLNGVMDAIIAGVDASASAVRALSSTLNGLTSFWQTVQSTLLAPVARVNSVLKGISRVLDKISFIKDLFTFKIKLKYPRFKPLGWGTIEVSLQDLAELIGRVERAIRRIPFIGFLFDLVEKIISAALSAIFPKIELPLPSFDFLENFSPFSALTSTLDNIVSSVSEKLLSAASVVTDWTSKMTDSLNLDSIIDRVQDSIPDFDLLNLCPEDSDGNIDFSCFANLAAPKLPGVPTELVQDFLDFFPSTQSKIENIIADSAELIVDGIMEEFTCTENSTIAIPKDAYEGMLKEIGINCTKDCSSLFGSVVPPEFRYCSGFSVDPSSLEVAFQPLVDNLTDLVVLPNEASGRRLNEATQADKDISNLGLTLTLTYTMPIRKILGCITKTTKTRKWKFSGPKWDRLGKSSPVFLDADSSSSVDNKRILDFRNGNRKVQDILGVQAAPDEPAMTNVNAGFKEVLALSVSVTRKVPKKGGKTRTRIQFSIGTRVQFQVAMEGIPDYLSIINPKLTELLQLRDKFDKFTGDCVKENSAADLFCGDALKGLGLELRKMEKARDQALLDGLLYDETEARPWSSLVGTKKKKARVYVEKLVKSVSSFTKTKAWGDLDKVFTIIERKFCSLSEWYESTFWQIRFRASGTSFPFKGIQMVVGNQVGYSPNSRNQTFTYRKDTYIPDPFIATRPACFGPEPTPSPTVTPRPTPAVTPSPTIALAPALTPGERQAIKSAIGNNAFYFQRTPASPKGKTFFYISGHVALGIGIVGLKIETPIEYKKGENGIKVDKTGTSVAMTVPLLANQCQAGLAYRGVVCYNEPCREDPEAADFDDSL